MRAAEGPATFSVDYVVTIRADDPTHARVRWLLAGIDEITTFRLVFRDDRATDVRGTGRLEHDGRTVRWTPGGPYAHLDYTVTLARARPPARYDSWAAPDWVATRALNLFPEINVTFRPSADAARARATLSFHLPPGWQAVAPGARIGPERFAVEEPGKRFARPRGWWLLGTHVARRRRTIAGAEVTVAVAPGSALDARKLLRLYARTMPLLAAVLGPPPPRLLVVSAGDPMWHGGLSGEDSFFVHGHLPLRSPDRTSTYLHELFHVWAPLTPARDGHWVSEGLAEYYSLALQHRAGLLSDDGFARGLDLFARYGRWGVDLAQTADPKVLDDSAPLVMWGLDRAIREASGDRAGLDDAVREIVREPGPIGTTAFLRAVNHAAGRDLAPAFGRLVHQGVAPARGSSGPREAQSDSSARRRSRKRRSGSCCVRASARA